MPVSLPVLPLRIRLSLRLAEATVHSESESPQPGMLPLRVRLSLRLAEVTVHSESESRSPQLRTQAVAQASDSESPGSGRSGSA